MNTEGVIMSREYLLSICMMVKDEEKNIRRCLDALKPLLDKPVVELIIVDTGSHDKTVDIAKEYTNKVYYHQWEKHFSEMRNITISYAKGEYIFILDADEVLMDSIQLYSIITDEQFRAFNTYIVKIKNLITSGSPTILPQQRVFRNDGDFHYEGAVHNQPRYKDPVLTTDLLVEHYGYLFCDDELREKKFLRTAAILMDELEKDPENVYYRFQLARSYNAHREKRKALNEIRAAHRLINNSKEKMEQHSYIYGEYASMCCINNEFSEAVQVCKEGLEIVPEYTDLYYMLAYAYIQLDKRIDACKTYIKYMDMVERFSELSISSNTGIEMTYMRAPELDNAAFFIAKEAFNECNYEEAYRYLKRITSVQTKIELLIKVLLKSKKFDELKETYLEYCSDKWINEKIIVTIEAERVMYKHEDGNELAMLFSKEEGLYPLLNRSRTGGVAGNNLLTDIAVKEADFNELPDFYAELFIDIDKTTRQIISIFKKLKKSKAKQYIRILIDKRQELKGFFEVIVAVPALTGVTNP
jgi:glycosyltransferase involved in cell wall biosynthesis